MESKTELRDFLRALFANSVHVSQMILGVVAETISPNDVPLIVEEANELIREIRDQECACDDALTIVEDINNDNDLLEQHSKTLH